MEGATSAPEVFVCQTCGDEGFTNAFIYCIKCLGVVIHRYCLDVVPVTPDEIVYWACDDCKPPLSYQFTSKCKCNPSQSDKDDPSNSALVKTTTHSKKIQIKKSLSLVAAEKDNKRVSGPNRIPLVLGLLAKEKNDPSEVKVVTSLQHAKTVKQKRPLKKKAKKKRKRVYLLGEDETHVENPPNSELQEALVSSDPGANQITAQSAELDDKTEKTKKRKSEISVENSSCESSCTDVNAKKEGDITHSEEGQRGGECGPDHDKLVFDSSSMEKKSNDKSKEVNGGDYASQSTYLDNNIHYSGYQPARPIMDPVWRGSFTIIQTNYDQVKGLVGHLSSKACGKVCEEATTLTSMLSLEMNAKAHLWPKSFLDSMPSDENIALYFFSENQKSEIGFQQLVNDMIHGDLAMKTAAKNAELLIFTSTHLPQQYQRFQGNYYLWGVFRNKRNAGPVHALSASQVTSEKKALTRVKAIESRSPQSPLCNYR